MLQTNRPNDFEIAPGFCASDWRRLDLRPDHITESWRQAAGALDRRISRRFFDPVDELIALQKAHTRKTFGFAILAIDCLIVETLQAFREGIIDHTTHSKRLFTTFLKQWDAFVACLPPGSTPTAFAERVYKDCRCALLHSGSTSGPIFLKVSGPMLSFSDPTGRVNINRTEFHARLKQAFSRYLEELLMPQHTALRTQFKIKMDAICG